MGTYVYEIGNSLYLNLTNKCSSRCSFCIRGKSSCLAGYHLVIDSEPDAEKVIELIGSPSRFQEVVFCGYGEPTYRLKTMITISKWLKGKHTPVRLDTNGHGDLINKKKILPELKGLVQKVSVSLNAATNQDYQKLCHPSFGESAFPAVIAFIEEAMELGFEVIATAVAVPGLDLQPIKDLAERLGAKWRPRMYN